MALASAACPSGSLWFPSLSQDLIFNNSYYNIINTFIYTIYIHL